MLVMEAEVLLPFSEELVLFHKSPYTELEQSSPPSFVTVLNTLPNIVTYLLTRYGVWIGKWIHWDLRTRNNK
jgi:hypothetical protein